MKQQANLIRAGQVIEHEGRRWTVLKQQIITPGKGGAFIQVEMRDLKSGNKTNERWRTADTVERLTTEEKEYTYSYSDGTNLVLMDPDTYEEAHVPADLMGDSAPFLQDQMKLVVDLVEGEPVAIHLPSSVVLEVVEADPVVKGQTASSSYKPARAVERREDQRAAVHRGRRAHRRPHRGRQLRGAREGLMAFRLSPHLTVMANAAQKASKRLLRDFAEVEQLQVSVKGPSDFVSQADIRAEQTLKEELTKARPGYSFLMEESGASGSENWTWRWIVDPLDGTTNFLHGIPHWAISIGLQRRLPDGTSEIQAGVIYAPAADEMFWAEKGTGAFMNERRLRVSARREMNEAVFATGIPFGAVSAPRQRAFSRTAAILMPQVAGIRRFGAAALDLAWVAHGRFDGYWELGVKPWDIAAGELLVREAGGYVTDVDDGSPLETANIVSGNPHLHPKLRTIVAEGMQPSA